MSIPVLDDPTTTTQQYIDADVPNFSTVDWVPTRGASPEGKPAAARGLLCTTAGTVMVDCYGPGGTGGSTSLSIPMTVGMQIQLAVIKIHHTGSTGAYIAFY